MIRNLPALACFIAAVTLSVSGCDRTSAAGAAGEPAPLTLTVFTPNVELYMEYPPLVKGEPAKFVSHFTVLATGEPVRSGRLTFEGIGNGGQTVTFSADKPAREGLFAPIHAFQAPGTYKARYVLDSPQVKETVHLGELVVHASKAAALAAGGGETEPERPGAVPFLMEQQWKISMLLHQVRKRTLVEQLHCIGEAAAPVDASAVVSARVTGRLLAPPDGKLPRLGDTVSGGQLLAFIEPPPPALTDLAVRALDLQTKALDIDRSLSESNAKLEFAKSALARLESLRGTGAVAGRQFDEAQRNLKLAEAEHTSAAALKAKYDEAAKQLTLLQSAAQSAASDGRTPGNPLRVPLEAPISGQIVVADHVAGEHIEAHEEVFRVINLERVWVVTRVSEFDLGRLPPHPNATIVPQAFPDRSFDVRQLGGRLVYLGSVVDPQSRTVSIRYELPNPDGVFRVGMLTDAFLEMRRSAETVAVPEQAIVMERGKPVAFVMLEGELYQRRELELGIHDTGFVEVKTGLAVGERVATRGAYAIKLSAMSGGFGPGHVH